MLKRDTELWDTLFCF